MFTVLLTSIEMIFNDRTRILTMHQLIKSSRVNTYYTNEDMKQISVYNCITHNATAGPCRDK